MSSSRKKHFQSSSYHESNPLCYIEMHKDTGRRGVFFGETVFLFRTIAQFFWGALKKCMLCQNSPTLGPCPSKDTCISYIMQINHPSTWAETFLVDFIEKSQPFQDGACCHDLDAPGVVRSLWHFFDLVIWMPTFFKKKTQALGTYSSPKIKGFIKRWLRVCGMFLGLVGEIS